MDPRFRLKRRFPGEDLGEPTPLGRRLLDRERESRPPRLLAGGILRVGAWSVGRKIRKLADPRPNAPLLIRIVRYPYALRSVRGKRALAFDAGLVARAPRLAHPQVMAEARVAWGVLIEGNPIKSFPTRVERLGRAPSVTQWLEGRRG